MRLLTTHLRLLLIIVMVFAPVQSAFSLQICEHTDSPVATGNTDAHASGEHAHHANSHQANSHHTNNGADEAQMLDANAPGYSGDCGNCQGSSQCGNCPVSLAIIKFTAVRAEAGTQFHEAIPDVSLNSTDLLPDYRPPRIS
jgi:hypothetical protein